MSQPTTYFRRHPAPAPGADLAPLSERERAVHVLSRLSFGHRPGEVERLVAGGVDKWLEDQLTAQRAGPQHLVDKLEELETLELSPLACEDYVYRPTPANATGQERRTRDRARRLPVRELVEAVGLRAIYSDRQADEVLCEFWRNHFNVSFTKGWPSNIYIPDYEHTVLRGNLHGTFADMLSASAAHPAMLHYLDNHLSRRPPSDQELAVIERNVRKETGSKERGLEAAAIASQRGLNENYARELMELHTLGVDRTYRQKDVISCAAALTGWGINRDRQSFDFKHDRHIEGDKKFLGHPLRKDRGNGPSQGLRILEILAGHNHTAEFLATKLVRFLVNDSPPRRAVSEVVKAFKKKGAELPDLVRAVIEHDDFWKRANYRAKFKTPFEFVVSALRATEAQVDSLDRIDAVLKGMGQPIYRCDDPTGYYDTAESWLDPGVMSLRWKFALELSAGELRGVNVGRNFYYGLEDEPNPLRWIDFLVERILPAGAAPRTYLMLFEAIRDHTGGGRRAELSVLGPQIVGLLLGSPEFQQQ
ncbi:MAG: hypothetical protein CMK00_05420 [Planctomycetes bacterium]|jgi:uncharacterized protein (DUF1800 family)|nr:hypothetical protein [Planctomycetota bacterium]